MWGRSGIVVLAALVVAGGAGGASARQLRLGRCALKPRASLVVRTPEVVVSSMHRTEEVDGESVTNPIYFTCLRKNGERHELFAASSDPSPDAGYESGLAVVRAAGYYVLYVSEFTQDNPDGPTTGSAEFHIIDVAQHDRQTLALPDPNYGLTGLGEVAISVDGYMAWAQLNLQDGVTTETVEADTGGGPTTLATAPIPDTLTRLAFHKLAFSGETLTWLYGGRPQSAQLKPQPSAPSWALTHGSRWRRASRRTRGLRGMLA
jgi:hypothetical protein